MKANRLGDIRAEHDTKMLDLAFYETPDYRTIIEPENGSKSIIVGRRGTGKSALVFKLQKHFSALPNTICVMIAPEDVDIYTLRALLPTFQDRYNLIRATFRLLWRYAIAVESFISISSHYKLPTEDLETLRKASAEWVKLGPRFLRRLTTLAQSQIPRGLVSEGIVGELAATLKVGEIEDELSLALHYTKKSAVILIDKLDEGYEPDTGGIAIVAALAHAISALNGMIKNVRGIVFLRDNIFRSIARLDSDFSRNLEGQVLRLHWDRYHLLNMIANRLRIAFTLEHESSQRVWDACTAQSMRGSSGFDRCLKLTLFRPRDLLILLNEAIYNADSQDRRFIDDSDIETTAKSVSQNRLNDLIKEYDTVIVCLDQMAPSFAGKRANWTLAELKEHFSMFTKADGGYVKLLQHAGIIGIEGIVAQLYSVGFLGIKDPSTGTYVFCHDGKGPSISLNDDSALLIHPCYWIGLGIREAAITPVEAQDIHDEYDVEVSSETPEIRNRKIGQIMAELDQVPLGVDGAGQFEEWCKQVLAILFAGSLHNFELHPNGNDVQRRDIVATNLGTTPVWKRVVEDYGSRQTIFEVKNVDRDIQNDEYRQALSYAADDYGKIVFVITRAKSVDLHKGAELDWTREIYFRHKVVIVKLTATWLSNLLSKLRSPQKHDAPNALLSGLLDRYSRLYLTTKASVK